MSSPAILPLTDRLRAACVGHPHAKIPWPHRLLHEAADALLAAEREKQELRRVLEIALIPLAVLVVSGECVDAPSALTEELKLAILQAHDEALTSLRPQAEALLGRKPVTPEALQRIEAAMAQAGEDAQFRTVYPMCIIHHRDLRALLEERREREVDIITFNGTTVLHSPHLSPNTILVAEDVWERMITAPPTTPSPEEAK